ncbi:thioesterase II family protein [Kitasatospora sp. NPDC101447]|uniref:thioesterase II family protein n=1 Tax=Kitasatospora sp. NPDC101447 TaxID=3364102 RepID=UPI003813AD69
MADPKNSGDASWFRHRPGVEPPALRLVCFPHAGAGSAAFADWQSGLPSGVAVLAACHPGRQDRLAEPPVGSMDELADRSVAALLPWLDRPYALFGHSMGSAVAYEVARRLAELPVLQPELLVASGRVAPHRVVPGDFPGDGDEEILASLREVSGHRLDAFAEPALRELLMPALRADYRVLRTYRPDRAVLDVPVAGCVGISDPRCDLAGIRTWAELTSAGFEHRLFAGDHFYPETHRSDLLGYLSRRLPCGGGIPVPARR